MSAWFLIEWGVFSAKGKSELAFLEGAQTAEKYLDTLGDYLFPFAHLFHGQDFEFQHDNASIHTVIVVKWYLDDQICVVCKVPGLESDREYVGQHCSSRIHEQHTI